MANRKEKSAEMEEKDDRRIKGKRCCICMTREGEIQRNHN